MPTKKTENYVLALNVGSTSIKSRVFVFKGEEVKEIFSWSKGDVDSSKGHDKSLKELREVLSGRNLMGKITAVGHRVVHGGPVKKSVKIGKKEINIIKKYSKLAPLHNPYNLKGILTLKKWWEKPILQAAVFDTAFYSSLPSYASTYALPAKLASRYSLYRYGFHGISHHYATIEASKLLKKSLSHLRLVTIHLGGGCSITASLNGLAVDTSMGFTPLEGLVMGTRSGDIDPGIIFYLAENKIFSLKEIKDILVYKSGIFGLSGAKNMLALLDQIKKGNPKAKLAFEIFAYRIQKYIGAYTAILGGCDGIVFTGAVGAGEKVTRDKIIQPLKHFILKKVPVLAVQPNEEKMIAMETGKLLNF